jgi:2-polyprenyl-3-methyl-5-hydroxy-6-metoxy-1,4-benzoquinol methylase
MNRYPRLFKFVQSELGEHGVVRILSFGCSTGEEVFTLRAYFPNAFIRGVDANAANIAAARKHLGATPDSAIAFEAAVSAAAEPDQTYDAVFCMAVLRHGSLGRPGVTRCDDVFPFEDFASAVAELARCLKPGGLLALRHSNFRLCDAPAGADFEPVFWVEPDDAAQTPVFGPDNRLMPGTVYTDAVFRKRLRP